MEKNGFSLRMRKMRTIVGKALNWLNTISLVFCESVFVSVLVF